MGTQGLVASACKIQAQRNIWGHAKSLEINPAVGDFYGTEIEILADCTGPKFGQHRDHLHCTAK